MRPERMRKYISTNGGFFIAYAAFCLVYILSLQYIPVTVSIEMKASASDTGQLFYDTGTGYREADSLWFSVDEPDQFKSYHLKLPGAKFTSLRIDPLTREGTFAVRSVSITAMNYHLKLDGELLRDALKPLNQVELIYRDGLVHGVSTGIDPQFRFDGTRIVNRLPLYISLIILAAFLVFLLRAKKLFPGSQYELSFAVFLVLFALPTVLPRILSLALALVALSLFLYLLCITKNRPGVTLNEHAVFPKAAGLKNMQLIYNVTLLVILLLAFLLRFWNLTILDPYTDEYSHLLAAKQYLDTGSFQYTRASLVTYLVALFYRIGGASSFYEYLFWARIPGVIFSSLTLVPLYFLTRKISPYVALISSFLWATSPWAIGVAKTIREYAFYPLLILLAALALVKLLELLSEYKVQHLAKIILCLIPVIALVVYAFRVDIASTIRICVVIFAGIIAYYLVLHFNRIRKWVAHTNKAILFLVILMAGLTTAVILADAPRIWHVSFTVIKLSDYWLRVFLVPGNPGAPMHWWGNYSFLAIAGFIAGIGLVHAVSNMKFEKFNHYFMHLSVFSLLLFFYVLFFDRYDRARYIFYALPFFIPLIAVSISALIDYAKRIKPLPLRIIGSLACALFLFQVFNYQNMLYPVFSDEHGYVKTTDEHHDSLKSTIALLENELVPEDVFITTIFSSVLILAFDIETDRIYIYDFRKPNRFESVEEFVEANPRGYMVLDWRRNGHFAEGYPHEGRFAIAETTVEVIQNKDGMQIYRWSR